MRRLIDAAVTLVVGVVGAPIIALIALLIVASLGRSVLFRQAQCGLEGRVFTVIKFRTMRPAASPALPVAQWIGRNSFVVRVHPTLTSGDVEDAADALREVLTEATA